MHKLVLCTWLAAQCAAPVHGFSALPAARSSLSARLAAKSLTMVEQVPRPDSGGFPFRPVVLGVLAVQAAFGLTSENEFGGLLTRLGDPTLEVNYFGTLLDAAFLSYGTSVLLNSAGVIKEDPSTTMASLNGMECQLKLNIGRESGTWMPKDWAASGARLNFPLTIRFSDEVVDLGWEGEETLNPSGSRYAKKLVVTKSGSFVSANGEVVVKANDGAWATEPAPGVPGASTLNFFVDFPEEAARNDVTLPSGRVFFSCVTWANKESLPDGIIDGAINMPDGELAGVVEGPGGVYILDKGGLSVKANKALNLWGALGDVMHILGRYTVASTSATPAAPSSTQAASSVPPASAMAADESEATTDAVVVTEGTRDPNREALDAVSAEIAERKARLAELEKKQEMLERE